MRPRAITARLLTVLPLGVLADRVGPRIPLVALATAVVGFVWVDSLWPLILASAVSSTSPTRSAASRVVRC